MKFAFLLTTFGFFVSTAFGSDVLDFSGSDFEDRVVEHDAILIEFFTPWCEDCKILAPEYEKAATTLKKLDPAILLAKVDCASDSGKATCSKYGVSRYPAFKMFEKGEFAYEYDSSRDSNSIVHHMKTQVWPSPRLLHTLEQVEKFLEDETVVIGYFSNSSSRLKEEFIKASDKLRETVTFGHVFNQEILEKYGYSDDIVLYRPKCFWSKFEPKEVKYTGSADKDEIEKFVKDNYYGLLGVRTYDNFADFHTPLVVAYYDVDYVRNVKRTNYWRNRIMKVAQSYKGQLTFAVSNKDKFSADIEDFGLSPKGEKPVVAAKNAANQKFNMKDEFSVGNFATFVKQFLDGTLEPYLKSAPLPEKNDGLVKVAVAQNFQELVTENEKDVFINFYIPWFGEYRKLEPIFQDLGKEMKNENVEIVKMDATVNDIPVTFDVRRFPALYLLPKNLKSSPKKYEGIHSLIDFINFIAKYATDELKKYDRSGRIKYKEGLEIPHGYTESIFDNRCK